MLSELQYKLRVNILQIDLPSEGDIATKRTLLQDAARMAQWLCVNQSGWDEPVSGDILNMWNSLIYRMHLLAKVQVPGAIFI